ncbi:MAG TPA: CdaR family protein, partial [Vicinamibacterales bacterium]|nr:CdaR family protein [Vicinamibacterales bacterium]
MRPVWPFGHLGLKLLSLAMAVTLWMVVAGEETVERGLRVPLELQQLPAGLELTGEIPSTVDVRVRGQSGALSQVSAGDVVAVLDLRGARSGHRLFPLTPDQVRAPFGVAVVQIAPSAIAMGFEPSASRQVPVVPAVDGRPAPGYVVGDKASDPRTVEVIGPESAVSRATEVVTEPVPVTGAHSTVRESVILGLLDPTLRLTNGRTAIVTVQIVPAPVERSMRGRPVHLRNMAPGLEAEALPNSVEVEVRGSRDALNRVQPDDISAYVDLEGLGPGEYVLTVHADSALDAGVTHIQPAS